MEASPGGARGEDTPTAGARQCQEAVLPLLGTSRVLTREHISILVTSPCPVLYVKVKRCKLGSPPLLSGAQFGRRQMTQRVVVGVDNAFVTQQVLPEFLGHGPLKGQELELHGTVVLHVPLSGPQTSPGVSDWSYFTGLLLGEYSTQTTMACVYL